MQVLSTGKTGKDAATAGVVTDLEAQLADAREHIHALEHKKEQLEKLLTEADARQQRRRKRVRPAMLRGTTRRMPSPLGDLYVTVNEDERGTPFEVFATLGKAGGAAMADVEAVGRLISLALRSGIPLQEVYQQLRGISCDRAVGYGPNKVLSVPDAIAQSLMQHEREKEGVQQELPMVPAPAAAAQPQIVAQSSAAPAASAPAAAPDANQAELDWGYDPGMTFIGTCPECKADLHYSEGCVKCLACGYSECG
jgi:ribonucleoside-diphosphate reductase alpha chain